MENYIYLFMLHTKFKNKKIKILTNTVVLQQNTTREFKKIFRRNIFLCTILLLMRIKACDAI